MEMVAGAADLRRRAGSRHRRQPAQAVQSINVVRCDEAAWRFLGLSLAGYNVLISLALAAVAAWGFLMGLQAAAARPDELDHGSSSVSQ